ncbi:MAG: rod shape-determining protein MreC [Porticoccaceae bacterium]|nr:rod shape-determining protein MreC [Porticoccaceae bacterium]
MKNVFSKSVSPARKILIVGLFSFALMAVDAYTTWLSPIYRVVDNLVRPFYWLTNIPGRLQEWGEVNTEPRADIQKDNARLKQESLIHRAQLQRMSELAAENLRLRQLLNATELLMDSVMVTEVIGVSPSPQSHTVTIDRGGDDGVYVGQPILDAEGLMGQIVSVYDSHSVALLITDSNHALPVQVLRNGVRSIAEGTSDYNRMTLRFVSPTSDIQEGDQLVSSGLGGRFPVGYPVGQVISIIQKPGKIFVDVEVDPSAELDRSRHLLLVFTTGDTGSDRSGR